MTIGQWIKEYCEENSIEMPTEIDNYTTQLDFLMLQNAGGGGSGDFTLANLTLKNNASNPSTILNILTPVVDEEYDICYANSGYWCSDGTVTWKVPCYKGSCYIMITNLPEGVTLSTSGDIEVEDETGYIITGDCEINFVFS